MLEKGYVSLIICVRLWIILESDLTPSSCLGAISPVLHHYWHNDIAISLESQRLRSGSNNQDTMNSSSTLGLIASCVWLWANHSLLAQPTSQGLYCVGKIGGRGRDIRYVSHLELYYVCIINRWDKNLITIVIMIYRQWIVIIEDLSLI